MKGYLTLTIMHNHDYPLYFLSYFHRRADRVSGLGSLTYILRAKLLSCTRDFMLWRAYKEPSGRQLNGNILLGIRRLHHALTTEVKEPPRGARLGHSKRNRSPRITI